MRKGLLATLCAIAVVAMMPSYAGNPANELPLNLPEKGAWCGLETIMAVVGDVIEHTTCSDVVGKYDIMIDVDSKGEGFGYVDNVDLVITRTDGNPGSNKGEMWRVTGEGDLNNVDLTGTEGNHNLRGTCSNTKAGDIIIGGGKVWLDATDFDWTFIKDLENRDRNAKTFIFDKGLEVITKQGYPRAKYRQLSKYYRPNGQDGNIWVKKTRIAPSGAPSCTIILKNLDSDRFGEGFQVWGKLQVK